MRRPNSIDAHLGAKLREYRITHGLSQDQLANAIGVTYQQVQKYERGASRISASRLFDLSQTLGVPIARFFDGAQLSAIALTNSGRGKKATPGEAATDEKPSQATLRLVQASLGVKDPDTARQLTRLIDAITKANPP